MPLTEAQVVAGAAALLSPPTLSSPQLVEIASGQQAVKLDTARDYLLRLPEGGVFPQGLAVLGGRNVVLMPGELHIDGSVSNIRGLQLKGQAGVMYVLGLRITGPYVGDGIDLDQRLPGAAVVLRDVTIERVAGSQATNHADLLQTWAGPARLVVSGFRGTSTYQGMFLLPRQQFADGPWPDFFYLENVHLDAPAYALWADAGSPFPIVASNVTVGPRPVGHEGRDWWLWPKPSTGDHTWDAVTLA